MFLENEKEELPKLDISESLLKSFDEAFTFKPDLLY